MSKETKQQTVPQEEEQELAEAPQEIVEQPEAAAAETPSRSRSTS